MSVQTDFIQAIAPYIQKYAKEYGYKVCSPIIAQACCESNYGRSQLSAKYHNYFGLKCGSYWKGASVNMKTKEEYTTGSLTTIRDNFRVYDSMEAGVIGYFEFIKAVRYSNLKSATTAREYLDMIKSDGYATSSSYVNTNMKIVTTYALEAYDALDASELAPPVTEIIYVKNTISVSTRLRIRNRPVNGNVVGYLYNSDNVTIYGVDNTSGWYRLSVQDELWISPNYVESSTKGVTTNDLNYRSSDSTKGEKWGVYPSGTEVKILHVSTNTGWYLTTKGWVSPKYVKVGN